MISAKLELFSFRTCLTGVASSPKQPRPRENGEHVSVISRRCGLEVKKSDVGSKNVFLRPFQLAAGYISAGGHVLDPRRSKTWDVDYNAFAWAGSKPTADF